MKNLVVLTGAGISAESGVQTFRAADGLWEDHRIEDVATPEAFRRNPELVHRFYNARRAKLRDVKPNDAHLALARLEKDWLGAFLLITQNVDDLHERAGSHQLVHMHGELLKIFCEVCEKRQKHADDLGLGDSCPNCHSKRMRPDIVWFGEMPYHMEMIYDALAKADVFISIGTSGLVYPAAGFSKLASRAHRIEVNLQGTSVSPSFHEHRLGRASEEVPSLVTELLQKN